MKITSLKQEENPQGNLFSGMFGDWNDIDMPMYSWWMQSNFVLSTVASKISILSPS